MSKTILVFAAHPDDEVLGCGGTIARYAHEEADVHIVFFTDGINARSKNKEVIAECAARKEGAKAAARILGAQLVIFGDFPDNRMDSVDFLDIVQFIERQVNFYTPEMILTHHANDLNVDHRLVHQAVVTACRPQPDHCVHTLLFFEVPSSTEWQTPASASVFAPNWFVDITKYMSIRVRALEAYVEEMRTWPHSRSFHAVEHLARWRGATVGFEAAEAFMLGRNLVTER
ncbi:MAG: GlcNAc-PI de-N-acetylase [Verrucomicrobia bacterium RIFCSPHIGHO2_12_FULL_41_10]|nr:MAG: GlcNAc-PI de-N-acetylase [Verrucomicrobia bacterium RIFCSPHIGHO2_12_FULL_41_10]